AGRDRRLGDRGEADGRDTGRPRPRGHVVLVVERRETGRGRWVVGDYAVAGLPHVAVAAAERRAVCLVRSLPRNARPAPREPTVRRAGDEDAALVGVTREVDVVVVRGPLAVVDDRRVV